MPGPTNKIRFTGTYGSVNNNPTKVSIIDLNYTGATQDFKIDIAAGGCQLSKNTDTKNIFDPINTMSCKLAILYDRQTVKDLFSDVKTANEGRFFIKVERGGQTIFVGKIIADEMELSEQVLPYFILQAIDGLTDLKNIDYVHGIGIGQNDVRNIIINMLNKADLVKVYENGETLIKLQTNLLPNVSFAYTSLFDIVRLNDYFYTIENDKKKPLKCWDVLVEILTRLNLKCNYDEGIYNIWGQEGYYVDRVGVFTNYDKLGTFVTGTSPSNTPLNINAYTLTGGVFRFDSGINKVVITPEKGFTNRFQGEGNYYEINLFQITSHGFVVIGETLPNKPYFIDINNRITKEAPITNNYEYKILYEFRLYNVITNVLANTIQKEFTYPAFEGEYTKTVELSASVNDYRVEVQAYYNGIITPNIPTPPTGTIVLKNKINYKVRKEATTDTTEYIAKLTNVNVKTKNIKIMAPDRWGKEFTKLYYTNGILIRELLEEGYKFNASDTNLGLEVAIAKFMLSILRNNLEYYTVNLNVKNFPLTTLRKYEYKGSVYNLLSYSLNLRSDIATCNFVKIPTQNNTGIITIEDVPVGLTGTVTSGFNAIAETSTGLIEEFLNVTTDNITLAYDILDTATFDSIKNSISVFVDGVRLRQVQSIGTKKGVYTVNAVTNVITFFRVMTGSNIIVKISKNFISGTTI